MFDLAKNESHPNTCTAMLLIKYTIYAQRKHPATQAGRNIHYTAILNKKPARVAGERRRIAPTNRKPSSPLSDAGWPPQSTRCSPRTVRAHTFGTIVRGRSPPGGRPQVIRLNPDGPPATTRKRRPGQTGRKLAIYTQPLAHGRHKVALISHESARLSQ